MTDKEDDIRYEKSDEEREIHIAGYQIFSSVKLLFIEAHIRSYTYCKEEVSDYVYELIHCKEGQIEYLDCEETCHLTVGDLAISSKTQEALAKEMEEYFLQHMDKHITLEQLAELFMFQ